jgi:diacylglycerol kinase (ATP)
VAEGRASDVRGAGDLLTDAGAGDGGRSVFVIFNPASGRGGGRRRIGRYLELLAGALPEAKHALTTAAGEESTLAERAIGEGYRTIVAVGGDGTWSHVADRILTVGEPGVRLAILPSGTGNDFGRSIGVDRRAPEEAVRMLARGHTVRVDVGRVNSEAVRADLPGAPTTSGRHFLNLVGFGFDIAVIDAARSARFLRGELLYKLTALQQLFRFPGFQVEVDGEGGVRLAGQHLMLTISNGRYFGGGFPIAPRATVTDGRLHACFIRDASPLERYGMFNLAEKGEHDRSPRVRLVTGQHFRARFPAPPRFEVDGDVYCAAQAEVEVEVLPGALEVVVPEPAA